MARKPQSKEQKVRAYLLRKSSISSWEAIEKFQVTRLAATIFNMREAGYNIKSVKINNANNAVRYYIEK